MRFMPKSSPIFSGLLLAALTLGAIAAVDAVRAPAAAEAEVGIGSANPMFRRHFWRGQSNHVKDRRLDDAQADTPNRWRWLDLDG